MSKFYLKNAKHLLLTYAQCGALDPFTVSDHLSALSAECIVGRERHADGGIHLHVFVDFGRQFSSRKVDIFDVGGYHPNIARVGRTPWKAYDYAIKDGDVCAGGLDRPAETSGNGFSETDTTWHTILEAETAEEFWELCHVLAPRDVARSFPSLQKYCDWRYRPAARPYSTPDGFEFDTSCAPALDEWLLQANLGLRTLGLRLVLIACGVRRCSWLGAALGLTTGCLARPGTPPSGTRGGPPLLAELMLIVLFLDRSHLFCMGIPGWVRPCGHGLTDPIYTFAVYTLAPKL